MESKPYFTSDLSMPHRYVRDCVEFQYGHHRTPWMKSKIKDIKDFLLDELGNELSPLIITATLNGALESILLNFASDGRAVYTTTNSSWVPGLRSLNIPHSFFSESEISSIKESSAIFLIDDVDADFKKYNLVSMVQDIYSISEKNDIFLNAANSFGSDDIAWRQLNVSGLIAVPERALGGIPGLSIVAIKKVLCEQSNEVNDGSKSYTFDLKKYYKSSQTDDTPYSPDISAIIALHGSIQLIQANGGLTAHIERQKAVATVVREFFAKECATTSKSDANSASALEFPSSDEAGAVTSRLSKADIIVDFVDDKLLKIGHCGFVDQNTLKILFSAVSEKAEMVLSIADSFKHPPDIFESNPLFEITKEENLKQIAIKSNGIQLESNKELLNKSATYLFRDSYSPEMFSYQNRTVGFIGAGRTVKESVKRLQSVGVKDIIVFSPSLAKKQQQGNLKDPELNFWENNGVRIATSNLEVFLSAHTVVLLPTYFNTTGANLYGKSEEYINEKLIGDEQLEKIRTDGKMDLLINASARSEIIDRQALAKHLNLGWLRFISDETPAVGDPVTQSSPVLMTGHIGGSADLTKQRIAENTNKILDSLLANLTGQAGTAQQTYSLNILNNHLCAPNKWRQPAEKIDRVKILMTDIFDVSTLDFDSLSKKYSLSIDALSAPETETPSQLISLINEFKPHILLIRTKTVITKEVAKALSDNTGFYFLVRPGVGVENINPGMEILSQHGIKIINEPTGNSFAVGELTTRFIVRGTPKLLLTPGPTPYSNNIFSAIKKYTNHRNTEFQDLMTQTKELLKPWINLVHGPIFTSSPSTGLMEAAIKNLTTKSDRGFVISHGKFGNRFIDIAKQHNRQVECFSVADEKWGVAHDVFDIVSFFNAASKSKNTISFMCLQQNETSGGVAYRQEHLAEIVAAARKHNPDIIIILDTVSGLFAHRLDFTLLDIDMVITGSQKGLGVSSGLSYATLSDRAIKKMLTQIQYGESYNTFINHPKRAELIEKFNRQQGVWYFSLLQLLADQHDFRFSTQIMSIFHVLCTYNSLQIMSALSPEKVAKRSALYAAQFKGLAQEFGLISPVDERYQSDSVSPALLPEKVDAGHFRVALEQTYGFVISGAQNEALKKRLIRVGHIGFVNDDDMVRFLRSLRILLNA